MGEVIPKIIHYVWLGGKEKPASILSCLASWQKYCPDYHIIEWNEKSFAKGRHPFVDLAIEARNWALASDIIRAIVLYEYGGLYIDTDVELLASCDHLLQHDCFMCYESKYWVGSAVLGSRKKHFVFDVLVHRFNQEREINFYSNPFAVHAISAVLRYYYRAHLDGKFKVIENIALLPTDFFYPIHYITLEEKRTANTIGVHYYAGSWQNKKQIKGARFASFSRKALGPFIYGWFEKLVADNFYFRIRRQFKRIPRG
ncbi:MAG: glycosyltransferase [Bacilli bacterium]|jgi:mannosyltransferase OCH1-like enzyme